MNPLVFRPGPAAVPEWPLIPTPRVHMAFLEVALGLGSNLGDRLALLRTGIAALAAGGLSVREVSSVYASAPVGYSDQPEFLNAVVVGRWAGALEDLLALAQRVEAQAGRERGIRDGPRTLDVDLLLVPGEVRDGSGLSLPHPRWAERSFVLAPLTEAAGGWTDPISGATVQDIWSEKADRLPEVRIVAPPTTLWSHLP